MPASMKIKPVAATTTNDHSTLFMDASQRGSKILMTTAVGHLTR